MFDLTNVAALVAAGCPIWCDREHRADESRPAVVVHESAASEQETADGFVAVRLVWEQQTGAAQISEPPVIEVSCWFGVLRLEPDRAGALIAALRRAGGPAWLVADLSDAAAVALPVLTAPSLTVVDGAA